MAEAALYFITGGVRSGKSRFAEQTAQEWAMRKQANLHYLACGRVVDAEMEERVNRHQEDRENSPIPWTTWEYPTDIERIAAGIHPNSVVLLDCLTTLVDNELFTPQKPLEAEFVREIFSKIMNGIEEVRRHAACLIIVSNEVIQEPIFHNEFLHTYAKMLGLLHQEIVERADAAYMVEWGIPIMKKGGAPI